MIVARVKRVSNPRRGGKRKSNPKRKLTAKQIKFFGTKRQRAALKRRKVVARPKHRARTKARNPVKRRRVRTVRPKTKIKKRRTVTVKTVVNRRRHKRRSNPVASIATLGFINPHRARRKSKPRRKSNKRRVVIMARRKSIVAHPRRRHHRKANGRRARRNPVLGYNSKTLIEMGGGVLAGVWATRLIPTLGPLAGIAGGSNAAATGVSLAAAVTSGILAAKIRPDFGKGVLLGGLAYAFTVFLDAFVPPVGAVVGLRGGAGMGALIPGASFSIPQNPFYGNQASGMAGLAKPAARAYPKAY